MDWYIEGNGVRAFVPFDEIAILLSKSKNQATSGIPAILTERYNPSTSPIVNDAKSGKSYGKDWVVNIFGCSTIEWFEKYITQGDFYSGFLNRFVYYMHEQQPLRHVSIQSIKSMRACGMIG